MEKAVSYLLLNVLLPARFPITLQHGLAAWASLWKHHESHLVTRGSVLPALGDWLGNSSLPTPFKSPIAVVKRTSWLLSSTPASLKYSKYTMPSTLSFMFELYCLFFRNYQDKWKILGIFWMLRNVINVENVFQLKVLAAVSLKVCCVVKCGWIRISYCAVTFNKCPLWAQLQTSSLNMFFIYLSSSFIHQLVPQVLSSLFMFHDHNLIVQCDTLNLAIVLLLQNIFYSSQSTYYWTLTGHCRFSKVIQFLIQLYSIKHEQCNLESKSFSSKDVIV